MLYFLNYVYNNLLKEGEIIFWGSLAFVVIIFIWIILKFLPVLYRKLFLQFRWWRWVLVLIIVVPIFFYNLYFIEKMEWDDLFGVHWEFFTYLPNTTNVLFLPYYFLPSDLPEYKLEIKDKDLETLNENLPNYYTPFSEKDRVYVSAKFYADGVEYDVEIRYRGDFSPHWLYRKKSLRVRFDKDDYYNGMREINLIIPKERNFLSEQYSNYLAKKIGIVSMDTEFIRLKINNGSYGIYFQFIGENKLIITRSSMMIIKI